MTLRSVAEMAVGVLFVIGAIFNTSYTLRHSRAFYGEFADGAWLSPARSLTNELIVPNGVIFTVVLIGFQLSIGIAILTRGGAVEPALVIGGSFACLVALFSSPGGTVGNLALAAIQFALAAGR